MMNRLLFKFTQLLERVQMLSDPSGGADPLANLRDIHLPPKPGLWPLAWGWWGGLTLFIIAVALLLFWLHRYKKNNRYRKLAEAELCSIETGMNSESKQKTLQNILLLLKRTAKASGCPIPNVYGKDWVEWIESCTKQKIFSESSVHLLATGAYDLNEIPDVKDLIKETRVWIRKHKIPPQFRPTLRPEGKVNHV